MVKQILKNGGIGFALLMAAVCFLLMLVLIYLFPENNPYQVYRVASVAISGLLLAMAIRTFKQKSNLNPFSLSNAFLAGAIPTILGTLLLALLVYVFLIISPESLESFKQEMVPSLEQAQELGMDRIQILTDIQKLTAWDLSRAEITQKLLSLFFVNILAAAYFRS